MRITKAYTALKRHNMMKDMIAMCRDYVPEGMAVGSKECRDKQAQLTQDVAELHEKAVAEGEEENILAFDDATQLTS